jgi:hypothetical protein
VTDRCHDFRCLGGRARLPGEMWIGSVFLSAVILTCPKDGVHEASLWASERAINRHNDYVDGVYGFARG